MRDADRIDLLNQALAYELSLGNTELEEFWRFAPDESFAFAESRRIVQRLRAGRRPA